MDSIAASKKVMLYGDFSYYKIIQVSNFTIRRLDEKYADYLQAGFLGWGGFGGNLINSAAVKHLITAAS
jgi:HK97 family phage major capsid protein